ncbi:hypothetical protein [Nocardia farcinica]|uniref:hypothetical protein n=1 Tax=Nocardia farcinica TaxID=37329 RepID=UPI002457CE61|nr:hypothetical protein [Nocardia farcinica]
MTDPTTDHNEITDALTKGMTAASNAASYWRTTAASLTRLYASGKYQLPWFDQSRIPLPFTVAELESDLSALTNLITKAHTLANLYSDEAQRLDIELADLENQRAALAHECRDDCDPDNCPIEHAREFGPDHPAGY